MYTVTARIVLKANVAIGEIDTSDEREAYSLAESYLEDDLLTMLQTQNETETQVSDIRIDSFVVEECEPNINEDRSGYLDT